MTVSLLYCHLPGLSQTSPQTKHSIPFLSHSSLMVEWPSHRQTKDFFTCCITTTLAHDTHISRWPLDGFPHFYGRPVVCFPRLSFLVTQTILNWKGLTRITESISWVNKNPLVYGSHLFLHCWCPQHWKSSNSKAGHQEKINEKEDVDNWSAEPLKRYHDLSKCSSCQYMRCKRLRKGRW